MFFHETILPATLHLYQVKVLVVLTLAVAAIYEVIEVVLLAKFAG